MEANFGKAKEGQMAKAFVVYAHPTDYKWRMNQRLIDHMVSTEVKLNHRHMTNEPHGAFLHRIVCMRKRYISVIQ